MLLSSKQKISTIFYYLFCCLSLLISCKSIASELDVENFNKVIAEVKSLRNSEPSEALVKLNAISDTVDSLPLIEQLTFYKYQADLYSELSRYQVAKDIASKALEQAKQLKTPSILIAELSYIRGFAIESLGDLTLANEDYLNGLDVAQSLNDKLFIAKGLINLGAIYYQTDRYEKALTVFDEALKIANELNDEELKGFINNELGILYAYFGEDEKSLKYYRKSYQHYKRLGKISDAVNSLVNIASNYQAKGNYEKAIEIYNELLPDLERSASKRFVFSVYMGLSLSYLHKKEEDAEQSYYYLKIAEKNLSGVEQPVVIINFYVDKAVVLKTLKRYNEALISLQKAEDLLVAQNKKEYQPLYLNILGTRANIYRSLGHYKKAYQLATEYVNANLEVLKNARMDAVQDMRIRYESEQAELQKKLLEQKSSNQALQLLKAKVSSKNQQTYFLLASFVVIIFAWLLVRLVKSQRKLLQVSRIDSLTGLNNRRRALQLGEKLFVKAKQNGNLSLLMIDIDNFKNINDSFGHSKGDYVLKTLGSLINQQLRQDDVFARFGGEEFIILLPNANYEQAIETAQRIRKIVAEHTWQLPDNTPVTVSIGVANTRKGKFSSLDQLIKQADDLLYKAKQQGRNKVCYE